MSSRETTTFDYDTYGRVTTKTVVTVYTPNGTDNVGEAVTAATTPAEPEPDDNEGGLSCNAAFALVAAELESAGEKFPPFNSAHEGFAVLKEEVDELWEEVKAGDSARQRDEAVQVAAMALRFLIDQEPFTDSRPL